MIVQIRWQHFLLTGRALEKCFHTLSSSADLEKRNWAERVDMASYSQPLLEHSAVRELDQVSDSKYVAPFCASLERCLKMSIILLSALVQTKHST